MVRFGYERIVFCWVSSSRGGKEGNGRHFRRSMRNPNTPAHPFKIVFFLFFVCFDFNLNGLDGPRFTAESIIKRWIVYGTKCIKSASMSVFKAV